MLKNPMNDQRWWKLNQDLLRPLLAVKRLGILSDFDGTLSYHVSHPAQAVITPENAHALELLTEKAAVVALVSGRGINDLRHQFPHPRLVYYGNHGLESDSSATEALAWRSQIKQFLSELVLPDDPGLILEDKGVAVAIHYRASNQPKQMQRRLQEQLLPLAARYKLKLQPDTNVWEIRPPIERDKGTAVREIVQGYQLNGVLYLGDDIGDIAAMRAVYDLRGNNDPTVFYGINVCSVSEQQPISGVQAVSDVLADGPNDVAQLLMWIAERL